MAPEALKELINLMFVALIYRYHVGKWHIDEFKLSNFNLHLTNE